MFLRLLVWGACAVFAGANAGCETPRTNMAEGRLYASGESRYDAFFKDVHTHQAAFAFWGDDKRTTRKSLTAELNVLVDVDEPVLIVATRERAQVGSYFLDEANPNDLRVLAMSGNKVDTVFAKAVEEAFRGERVRARKLRAAESALLELERIGRELQKHVAEDFSKKGLEKSREVRRELEAGIDAAVKLKIETGRLAKEAEDCASALAQAVQAKVEPPKGEKKKRPAPPKPPRDIPKGVDPPKPISSGPPGAKEKDEKSGEIFSP